MVEPVKARQVVVGHADHAEPFGLEAGAADLRVELAQRALGPGAMHGQAGSPERADAAEDEPPRLVEADGAEHRFRIPGALPLGPDLTFQVVGENRKGDVWG